MGFLRSLYWVLGWEYDSYEWDKKQRDQKYLVIKQIENSKVLKLKPKKSKSVPRKSRKIRKKKKSWS